MHPTETVFFQTLSFYSPEIIVCLAFLASVILAGSIFNEWYRSKITQTMNVLIIGTLLFSSKNLTASDYFLGSFTIAGLIMAIIPIGMAYYFREAQPSATLSMIATEEGSIAAPEPTERSGDHPQAKKLVQIPKELLEDTGSGGTVQEKEQCLLVEFESNNS